MHNFERCWLLGKNCLATSFFDKKFENLVFFAIFAQLINIKNTVTMRKSLLLLGALACMGITGHAQGAVANFSCDEATVAYYEQGWDSQDEADTWSYQSTSSETWQLRATPTTYGATSFTTVESDSQYSLTLKYGSNQHETATSPAIDIRPGSTLEFYCFANAGYLIYGAWKLYAIEGESQTLLIDQFLWAQDNAYDGQRWVKFEVDLAQYAGKSVKFSFVYEGNYGEDEALDGFRVVQVNDNAASITINEGDQVHFKDLSTGNVDYRKWTFYGGEPATSTEQNPVVTYNEAGTYTVRLEVGEAGAIYSSTKLIEGYVIVKGQAPDARIGMPEEAYLSPFRAAFVPVNVPVQFRDLSTGRPTEWAWEFTGTYPLTSTDQNPFVTYTTPGTYSLMLTASNALGSDQDAMLYAVQAGGAQYIWNIAPEENSDMAAIEMGWYGNYGGTNWLGMSEFAEHFQAPLAVAQIDSVAVYFAKTTCVTPDADITVKIVEADEQGMPGNVLAQSTIKASELKYDEQNVVETVWNFDQPVRVDGEFFVTIGGFPNNDGDDIAMLVHRREVGEKCSAWQCVLDEGENWDYLDTGKWYENVDDPMSFAICPILDYNVTDLTALPTTLRDSQQLVTVNGDQIDLTGAEQVSVYDINGRQVLNTCASASLSGLPSGVYVVRALAGDQVQTLKVIK